jgi:hypothetical protein
MLVKTWNCTGLSSKLKSPLFRRWLQDTDIAALQETFLDTKALQISGFTPFISPAKPAPAGKKHRATGGLVTLVSSSLASLYNISRVDGVICDGLEGLCLLFERTSATRDDLPSAFLVFNCYVVAQPGLFDFSLFYFALEAFLLARDLPVVLLGDFNAHWKLSDSLRVPSPRDQDFRDFVLRLEDSGFLFYPSSASDLRKPTFVSTQGCSIIDYIFVRGVECSRYQQQVMSTFGHRALEVSLKWPAASLTPLRDRTSHRRHFRESPPATFWPNFLGGNGLQSCADFLRVGVSRIFVLFVLSVGQLFQVSKGHEGSLSEPWHRYLSAAEMAPLKQLEREVFNLTADAQLGVAPLGLSEKNSELRRLERSLHALATRRLFEDVRGSYSDPTQLWSFVRKFRVQSSQGVLPIDVLVDHFKAVFNRVTDTIPMVFCECDFEVRDEEMDSPFSISELESAFRVLDRGSAPGITGIGNGVLQDLFRLPDGPQFFLHLFNACFLGGHLPDLWRNTEIFLLYKGKGDFGDPGSYRGIALMESAMKLYERLLFNRLSRWARFHGRIPDCQFGFRPRSSTLDAVFVFYTLLVKYVLVFGSTLHVCLVDFQKAFPSVHRAQLLDKLGEMGVSPRFRRAINSGFVNNTFTIRQGSKVTSEHPVTTGLREGSVLSPLLFILFISDMCASVLRPFRASEFLKRDPSINGIPVPGLLYADDLVLFCLNGDLLRERLRRLSEYIDRNTLSVNVSKCEIVIFGAKKAVSVFKFKRQVIPVRHSCKYLGVWLDGDMSGRALAAAIVHKFTAAVPVFFQLCRGLRLARLDLVYRLASSLLFSLLYGAEFLRRVDIIQQCEEAWWRGVRSFFGLPNGVSGVALRMLFPRVSLTDRVLIAKFGLLIRGSRRLDTIFPEAIVCDRGSLLGKHRKGYSQTLLEWCQFLGVPAAFDSISLAEVREAVATSRARSHEDDWSRFSSMSSTRFAATVFGSRDAISSTLSEASRFGSLGVRVVLLALTGSLSVSYLKSRSCLCGEKFTFEHYLSCSLLNHSIYPTLQACIGNGDWRGAAVVLLSRFEVFVHAARGGELRSEEVELFQALNASVSDSDPSPPCLESFF